MAADDGGPRETEGPEPGVAYGSHLASSLPDQPLRGSGTVTLVLPSDRRKRYLRGSREVARTT